MAGSALPCRDRLDKLEGSGWLLWALPVESLPCLGVIFYLFPVYNDRKMQINRIKSLTWIHKATKPQLHPSEFCTAHQAHPHNRAPLIQLTHGSLPQKSSLGLEEEGVIATFPPLIIVCSKKSIS